MKHLVYLITSFDKGGAEVQVAKLAQHFSHCYKVTVVSMLPMTEQWIDLHAQNFRFVDLGMQRGRLTFRQFLRAGKTLAELKPDLVHSHMVHANLLARLTRIFYRRPLICTAHSVIEVSGKLHSVYRATRKLANLNTHVSREGLKKYQREGLFGADDIAVYNGVPLTELPSEANAKDADEPMTDKPLVFGFLGKLRIEKNLPLLMAAIDRYAEHQRPFRLLIAGDGEGKASLEQWISRNNLGTSVTLLGLVDDIEGFFATIDALLLTSHHEGLPMALIEAGANRTPCICTNVGGVPEIVDDNATGWLVTPDDANALANAMLAFADLTDEQRASVGEAARQKIERTFNLASVTARWQSLYAPYMGK